MNNKQMLFIDESLNNADWVKKSWDLSTDIKYYISRYGEDLLQYVNKLKSLPVWNSIPEELKLEFYELLPELRSEDTESKGTRYVRPPAVVSRFNQLISKQDENQLKTLLIELKKLEEKIRYVRDSDYWGVPYNTPIVPGMKPIGQMPLPGMPKLPRIPETDQVRLERRSIRMERRLENEDVDVDSIRQSSRHLDYLIERAIGFETDNYDSDESERITETILNEFGVSLDSFNPGESELGEAILMGGDWTFFGACRDIRNSAYDILGFADYEKVADPAITYPGDPGWGGSNTRSVTPDTLAYSLLEKISTSERLEFPAWRGVSLFHDTEMGFINDLKENDTFDLPIASFAGERKSAERFGKNIIFKLLPGARHIVGGYMGVAPSDGYEDFYEEDTYEDPKYREIVSGGRFKITSIKDESINNGDGTAVVISISQVSVFDPNTGIAKKAINQRWRWAYLFDDSLLANSSKPTTNALQAIRNNNAKEVGN